MPATFSPDLETDIDWLRLGAGDAGPIDGDNNVQNPLFQDETYQAVLDSTRSDPDDPLTADRDAALRKLLPLVNAEAAKRPTRYRSGNTDEEFAYLSKGREGLTLGTGAAGGGFQIITPSRYGESAGESEYG